MKKIKCVFGLFLFLLIVLYIYTNIQWKGVYVKSTIIRALNALDHALLLAKLVGHVLDIVPKLIRLVCHD